MGVGVPSSGTFQTIAVTITAPGTAERVTGVLLRDGQVVSVTARRSNAGNCYLAETQAKAQSGARKVLIPGQSRDYYVGNTAIFWMDADNATDALEFAVESDSSGGTPS